MVMQEIDLLPQNEIRKTNMVYNAASLWQIHAQIIIEVPLAFSNVSTWNEISRCCMVKFLTARSNLKLIYIEVKHQHASSAISHELTAPTDNQNELTVEKK
jgi:hypothetical protein